MMQPRHNGRSGNGSVSLDRSTQRHILVQRKLTGSRSRQIWELCRACRRLASLLRSVQTGDELS